MIISRNSAGLCNRIKCWVSSMRIDEECYVDWPAEVSIRPIGITTENMPSPSRRKFPKFEELFDNENIALDASKVIRRVNFSRPDDVLNCKFYDCKKTLKTYTSCKFAVLPSDNVDRNFIKNQQSEKSIIDLQFHRTPENIITDYKKLFKKIKFKKSITSVAEKFFHENLKNKKILSVHVRSYPTSPKRAERWYDINNYFKKIDVIKDHYDCIFLASDGFLIQNEFKKRYPDKLVYFPKKFDPMGGYGSFENQLEAIVDMILLGKGTTLLATETSTYSEVAWWLAECKPDVIKIGNIIYE